MLKIRSITTSLILAYAATRLENLCTHAYVPFWSNIYGNQALCSSYPSFSLECCNGRNKTMGLEQIDKTIRLQALTYGSIHPAQIAITQAFTEQSGNIGWKNFLRGCSSKHWGEAYTKCQANNSRHLPPLSWSSEFVPLLLSYSAAAWTTRNAILHGINLEENRAKEKALLTKEIRAAYKAYSNNHFIIPYHLSSLFSSWTLQQRLSQEIDSMQCWLRSYEEGVQENTKSHAESAKNFFLPRRTTSPINTKQPPS
jgi:hypothetical protein